jgi:hypothetical protein
VEEVDVCSATAADDDDALALHIEMVDVEDDDAAAALQIAVNNVMVSMRDGFIVFILFLGGRVYKAIFYLWNECRGIVMVICFFLSLPSTLAKENR